MSAFDARVKDRDGRALLPPVEAVAHLGVSTHLMHRGLPGNLPPVPSRAIASAQRLSGVSNEF